MYWFVSFSSEGYYLSHLQKLFVGEINVTSTKEYTGM